MHLNNLKIDAESVNEGLSFSFFSVLVYFRSTKWQYLVIQIKLVLKFWPWRRKEIHLSFLPLYKHVISFDVSVQWVNNVNADK